MSASEIVPVGTSLRQDERDKIDALSKRLSRSDNLTTQAGPPSRSATARALLRFALEHEEYFLNWIEREDGKPV